MEVKLKKAGFPPPYMTIVKDVAAALPPPHSKESVENKIMETQKKVATDKKPMPKEPSGYIKYNKYDFF
jgi:hypothetical protein